MTDPKPGPMEVVELIDECHRKGAPYPYVRERLREAGLAGDEVSHALEMVSLAYRHAVEGGASESESDPYYRAAMTHARSLRRPWWKFW